MKYGDIRLIGIFVKYDQYTIYVSKFYTSIIVIVISVWYYCTHHIYFSVYRKNAIYREKGVCLQIIKI